MKYISLTLQYLFKLDNGKRFLALFLFALPPGLVLSYYFPITGYLDWFVNYSGNYASYSDLWLSLVERDTLKIGLLILGYILVIFSVSAITTLTVRSARIGKFQVKSVFYLINENFFSVFLSYDRFFDKLDSFSILALPFLFPLADNSRNYGRICACHLYRRNRVVDFYLYFGRRVAVAAHNEHKRTETL